MAILPGMEQWAQRVGYDPAAPQPKEQVKGYAATPGFGPAGETCRTCRHACSVNGRTRDYYKCGVIRHRWTHGPGTDIRLKSPACRYWEKKTGGSDATDG